jgi:hypothetical protein
VVMLAFFRLCFRMGEHQHEGMRWTESCTRSYGVEGSTTSLRSQEPSKTKRSQRMYKFEFSCFVINYYFGDI